MILAYGLPSPPLIRFAEAEAIGAELHDRWQLLSGADAPLTRDDMAWGDVVQFVIRRAAEVASGREAT